MRCSFVLWLLLSTPLMAEQVYRCTTDTGKTIYSQFPCGEDAAAIDVAPQPATITPEESLEIRNKQLESLDAQSKRLERRRLKMKLKNLEASRNSLSAKRERELETLYKELREAYDFRDRRIIQSRIDEVRYRYWEYQRQLNDKIRYIQIELSSCCR